MKRMLKWPGKIKFIVSILKNSHGIKWNYGYDVYYLIVQKYVVNGMWKNCIINSFTIRNSIMKISFLTEAIWGVEGIVFNILRNIRLTEFVCCDSL